MNGWQATPIDARACVFAAQDISITPLEGHLALPAGLGWDSVLDHAHIDVVTIPGNHETIVKFHADMLGRAIGEQLVVGSVVE